MMDDAKDAFDALESDKEAAKERWLKLGQKDYKGSPSMSEFLDASAERDPMLSNLEMNGFYKNGLPTEFPGTSEFLGRPSKFAMSPEGVRDHYESLITKGVLRVVKKVPHIWIDGYPHCGACNERLARVYNSFCPGCACEIQKP